MTPNKAKPKTYPKDQNFMSKKVLKKTLMLNQNKELMSLKKLNKDHFEINF
jgi:hypothetical protein